MPGNCGIARLDAFLGVARGRAGSHQAAVENHRGAGKVFGSACPHSGLDAHALVVLIVAKSRDALRRDRRQGAQHIGICRIAARSQKHGFLCIDLDVTVFGFEDSTGHATALFANELGEQMAVGHPIACFVDVLFEQDVALFDALAVAVLVGIVMLEWGRIERGATHAVRHIVFVGDDHRACRSHDAVHEGEHLARFVHPHFDETLVAIARGITDDFTHQTLTVHRFAIGERRRIERCEPMARCAHLRAALAHHEINPLVGRICRCRHAAVARADNQQVAFLGFGDIGDFGGLRPTSRRRRRLRPCLLHRPSCPLLPCSERNPQARRRLRRPRPQRPPRNCDEILLLPCSNLLLGILPCNDPKFMRLYAQKTRAQSLLVLSIRFSTKRFGSPTTSSCCRN